jgi:hypothetical protein
MDADPELKQKVLEDQRRRGKIYRELLNAKKKKGWTIVTNPIK